MSKVIIANAIVIEKKKEASIFFELVLLIPIVVMLFTLIGFFESRWHDVPDGLMEELSSHEMSATAYTFTVEKLPEVVWSIFSFSFSIFFISSIVGLCKFDYKGYPMIFVGIWMWAGSFISICLGMHKMMDEYRLSIAHSYWIGHVFGVTLAFTLCVWGILRIELGERIIKNIDCEMGIRTILIFGAFFGAYFLVVAILAHSFAMGEAALILSALCVVTGYTITKIGRKEIKPIGFEEEGLIRKV